MIIHDEEFGNITVRRSARATQIRVRVAPNGTLRASIPLYAPVFLLKRLLKTSRNDLRELLGQSNDGTIYTHNMQIGKSHVIVVEETATAQTTVKRKGRKIVVTLGKDTQLNDAAVSRLIRDATIGALRIEAKSYLPKRLEYLSEKLHLPFSHVRFSHASGRWGSCNTKGTISLNIALMKLPFELIDYVIVHELSHTKHMNHSQDFWQLVEEGDPEYRIHRRMLKQENPSI